MEKRETDRGWLADPAGIEARSMQIIEEELRERGVSCGPDQRVVLRRVIHATADFDYVQNLVFSRDAVREGKEALLRGSPVVTDTNMARAGISSTGLERVGSKLYCFMADPDVARMAKQTGTTRAVAAVEKAVQLLPGAVFAIGNAPTALYALAEQIRGGYRPSLVIGAPVGFVNVREAKEEIIECCREYGIGYIVARGRKGGSSASAAIANALIYEAARMTDPYSR